MWPQFWEQYIFVVLKNDICFIADTDHKTCDSEWFYKFCSRGQSIFLNDSVSFLFTLCDGMSSRSLLTDMSFLLGKVVKSTTGP